MVSLNVLTMCMYGYTHTDIYVHTHIYVMLEESQGPVKREVHLGRVEHSLEFIFSGLFRL